MPELPEVETVRNTLRPLIIGKTIQEVIILYPKIIENMDGATFAKSLIGEKVEEINRRGKFLIFRFTHFDLISHLRMEGKYQVVNEAATPITKHTHILFTFTDGSQLRYQDVRKFGRMVLVLKNQALQYKSLVKLGPEPTAENFLLADFAAQLKQSKKEIKPLLLEQKIVVGLGNIYVDETLWLSQIHPLRRANSLSDEEVVVLHDAIILVLQQAILAGGTTIRSYHNAVGEEGHFQQRLHVYGKTGLPCDRCGTPIVKIKVGGRGTHFCPQCQKE
ncbi:DNA-formamidopyrimidine glycosylase [Enterococcus timonensis]|uniref:DNA-formamidopyrimidine glycosylase n=1 Tax=Enterococcus timonensis TaxID=1852364 RepID=UPI0008DABAA0|nr:DNA-formamidopyrimidine glycosylase [Enterococcus timonensis]